jgi:hypothetical protein
VQARGWRKEGRMRVWRLYIAAIVEGKGGRGMEAGIDGATPMSANAQGSLGEEKGVQYQMGGQECSAGELAGTGRRRR